MVGLRVGLCQCFKIVDCLVSELHMLLNENVTVPNSNTWPILARLRDISLQNLSDLDIDLSRSKGQM